MRLHGDIHRHKQGGTKMTTGPSEYKCEGQNGCYGCPYYGDDCDGHETKEERQGK